MGLTDKIKDFIAPEEEEEIEYSRSEEVSALSEYETSHIGNSDGITENTSIALFEPRNFDEAEEIGRHIKNHRACCVNLHRMPGEYHQRIIDFLAGVVYGLDGSIKRIGDGVILCSPANLRVGGDINLTNNTEEY